MSLNDPLANVLSAITNAEKKSMKEVIVKHNSKIIREVLTIMKAHGFIGEFSPIEDSGKRTIKINLLGRINSCGVIKPRYNVNLDKFEKFEKSYLPAKGFGIIIISTNKGLLTLEEAKKNRFGGVLISYCY